ncbi:NAD(P)-binding protein, partial [Hymenopellis radicata]
LLVGGTGRTGQGLARALLETNKFFQQVLLLVRSESVEKPVVSELKNAGAQIRIGDITESPETLEAVLQGVDILISLVLVSMTDQKPLLKKAGVGRVVPSDFGPHAPRGVMAMHDIKLDIREYIKELGVPYTFIEVGWWLQLLFPYPHATPASMSMLTPKNYIGDRRKKLAYSTVKSLASLVVRIIDDLRTINQTVIACDGETNVDEAWAIAEKISGEDFSDYTRVPDEDILARTKSSDLLTQVISQYANSLFLRGDNTLAHAVADGALVARELYPDAPVYTIEEAAKEFYANPP